MHAHWTLVIFWNVSFVSTSIATTIRNSFVLFCSAILHTWKFWVFTHNITSIWIKGPSIIYIESPLLKSHSRVSLLGRAFSSISSIPFLPHSTLYKFLLLQRNGCFKEIDVTLKLYTHGSQKTLDWGPLYDCIYNR